MILNETAYVAASPHLATYLIASSFWTSVYFLVPCLVLIVLLVWGNLKHRRLNQEHIRQIELLNQSRKYILDFLHDLGEAFTEGIELDELLYMITSFSVTTTQAASGAVFLFDQEKKHLRAEVVIGLFPPPLDVPDAAVSNLLHFPENLQRFVKSQIIPMGQGIIGQVAKSGKPILIQDGLKDPRVAQHSNPALQIRTAIYIPLKFKQEVLGVMALVNKQTFDLAAFFTANDLFILDSLADHAAISLYNATLYKIQAAQKQMDSDLRVASEIQKLLLPDHAPVLKNFQVTGCNLPARHVGGDYYDFLPLNESQIGIVISDVSGKAIPSALVMTICRSAIRAQAKLSQSPTEVLQHVHESVIGDLREDMFVTIVYGVLDTERRTFTFVRAGHDPMLYYRAAAREVEIIAPKGIAVGLDRSHRLDVSLKECQLQLDSGDILVLYTDGITEALNTEDQEFGRERLSEIVSTVAKESATRISEIIFENLKTFTNGSPPHDDRTLLIIKAD